MSQIDQTNIEGPEGNLTVYMDLKRCSLCGQVKHIPEYDKICRDCWELRMVGRALVRCPFYLYEYPNYFKDGMAPIELCYDCAFRSGWTEELGPICDHPIAVMVREQWDVVTVLCPKGEPGLINKDNPSPYEDAMVSMESCKACPYHKGELQLGDMSSVYCGVPHEITQQETAPEGGNGRVSTKN